MRISFFVQISFYLYTTYKIHVCVSSTPKISLNHEIDRTEKSHCIKLYEQIVACFLRVVRDLDFIIWL